MQDGGTLQLRVGALLCLPVQSLRCDEFKPGPDFFAKKHLYCRCPDKNAARRPFVAWFIGSVGTLPLLLRLGNPCVTLLWALSRLRLLPPFLWPQLSSLRLGCSTQDDRCSRRPFSCLHACNSGEGALRGGLNPHRCSIFVGHPFGELLATALSLFPSASF